MSNEPTFAERCEILRNAGEELKALAEAVALEALRMSAAQKRFAERRGNDGRRARR